MSIVMILHQYHVNVGHTLLIIGDSMLLQYGCTNFIIILIQYCIVNSSHKLLERWLTPYFFHLGPKKIKGTKGVKVTIVAKDCI